MPPRHTPNQSELFADIGWSMGAVEQWAERCGYATVIGVDEAGRGPLAGPVVAAAVCLDVAVAGAEGWLDRIADSKQLSPTVREDLFTQIRRNAHWYAMGQSESWEIDASDILRATHKAMATAVGCILAQHPEQPLIVVVDGASPIPDLVCQRTVVKGDQRSYNVAAASILAKVTRDRIMKRYATLWPLYGFEAHKGYPTAQHRRRILQHGYCPVHRRSFRLRPPPEDDNG
ncbi:MAG: ribonuclease HII [Bradymonadales bacterium]|nr:ribonuclease HII [Bradymonadales bacterium]